jgi:hypothetical protein
VSAHPVWIVQCDGCGIQSAPIVGEPRREDFTELGTRIPELPGWFSDAKSNDRQRIWPQLCPRCFTRVRSGLEPVT